jgi:two-component system, chemotaxis family, sensor kinase CheA
MTSPGHFPLVGVGSPYAATWTSRRAGQPQPQENDDMDELDEVVGEFLVESFENLDRMDDDLLALERQPDDLETIASIFRAIHTIKGTCGFLGFERLEKVTHVGENLLGKLREGELQVTAEIATALLATTDAVRGMLGTIEETGADGDADHSSLIATLEALYEGRVAAVEVAAPPAPVVEPEPETPRIGELLVASGGTTPEAVDEAAARQLLDGDVRPLGEILVDSGQAEPAEVAEALERQQAGRGGIADTSIRVDVGLLDNLMNLVGELVLARNQILQLDSALQEAGFTAVSQRLNHITSELQEGVMKTRMQPIGNVWGKFPRVVRDLAMQCGKQVRVEMQGQETELDKTIIEAIKDPLTHLVRNSVDHGIEPAGERVAAGKPAEGRLSLRAFHEGGQVNIEIVDDGAGIDAAKMRAKAVERGLVTAEAAERMGERESLQLIFAPGFSTAAAVTNVSGRGVGMDVVKTNIERIGGTVDLSTEKGRGTTFRIRIPLTLAIVPALVIGSGGERFAVPQISLVELVRLEGAAAASGIEHVHGAPVYRLRGKLLPIVRLSQELRLPGTGDETVHNIVVLQSEGQQFGLLVDAVHDTQEIVVKPLDRQLKDLDVYAGATIMGDGHVALILDVAGLGQRARVIGAHRPVEVEADEALAAATSSTTSVLVVDLGGDHRAAVPLSAVDRLEELAVSAIEPSAEGPVVQYRGEIMPLVSLSDALGFGHVDRSGETVDVIVHARPGGRVGLLVGRIVDIVEEDVDLRTHVPRYGVAGSAVLQGRVTDVVDVEAIIPTRQEVA